MVSCYFLFFLYDFINKFHDADVNHADSQSTMRTASLLCLNSGRGNIHAPLVPDKTFVRSTNHDRLDDNSYTTVDNEDCTELPAPQTRNSS